MIQVAADIAMFVLTLAVAGSVYRVIRGPSMADRVVAMDAIAINLIGIISVFSLKQGTLLFLDVILVIAILGFVGTVALSKFMVRGVIIDRARD